MIINLYDDLIGGLYSSDTIVNNIGSDWFTLEYYYSDCVFLGKIKIFVTGKSTENLGSWYIDNIKDEVCGPMPQINFVKTGIINDSRIVNIDWFIHVLPCCLYWIDLHDGLFEQAFASTDGGSGTAQLFDMENDFPNLNYPFTICRLGYWNSWTGCTNQEELYLMNGDGSEVLTGPYYISNTEPGDYVYQTIDPIVIEDGNFMIATINTSPGGPYIGVDDSYYSESLFYGSVGDWTELSELGEFYYVGSHMAQVYPGTYMSPVKYNVYRKFHGQEFVKINDSLLSKTEYTDTIPDDAVCTYYVTGVYEGCESDSSENIIINPYVGQDEIVTKKSKSFLFPNPANEFIEVFIPERPGCKYSVAIYDISGRLVLTKKGMLNQNSSAEIDVSKTQTGIYFVKMNSGNESFVMKIIVQR